jgi:ubiquinone/menaquinone biosynthesis C-methylase UbiE
MISQKQLADHYRTSNKQETKALLHEQFSTNKYDWVLWMFDQFDLPASCKILDLGCGTGRLWSTNLHRLPQSWSITLSDFSAGMVAKSKEKLRNTGAQFGFEVFDAQEIPLTDESFDVIIANHMLYHVRNLTQTLGEIHRVLKSSGRLYASTVGMTHMKELDDLKSDYIPHTSTREVSAQFSLENGRESLEQFFANVELRRREDSLLVTEAAPLVAYVLSGLTILPYQSQINENRKDAFAKHVEAEMHEQGGAIRITKDAGLFIASKH